MLIRTDTTVVGELLEPSVERLLRPPAVGGQMVVQDDRAPVRVTAIVGQPRRMYSPLAPAGRPSRRPALRLRRRVFTRGRVIAGAVCAAASIALLAVFSAAIGVVLHLVGRAALVVLGALVVLVAARVARALTGSTTSSPMCLFVHLPGSNCHH